MWLMHNVEEVPTPRERMSARGRLTARVLEMVQGAADGNLSLQKLRPQLEEVLATDSRYPFHLAAYLQEKLGQKQVAVALLVEAANLVTDCRRRAGRPSELPFSLRPLVARVVRNAGEAALAMSYQVRHFGWHMPRPLRAALAQVVKEHGGESASDSSDAVPLSSAAGFARARVTASLTVPRLLAAAT